MSRAMIEPLYRRLLAEDFDRLPPAVRLLHDVRERAVWAGRADVERGSAWICRLICALSGLPRTGSDQPLTVEFVPTAGDAEIWRRTFGRKVFQSRQWRSTSGLQEQIGPARLMLLPKVTTAGLTLSLAAIHLFGIPVPRPIVETREFEKDGRYRFEVEARFRGLGRLVRYAGWLEPAVPLARIYRWTPLGQVS